MPKKEKRRKECRTARRKAEVFLEESGGVGKRAAVDIVEKDGEREKDNDAGQFRRELCGDSLARRCLGRTAHEASFWKSRTRKVMSSSCARPEL